MPKHPMFFYSGELSFQEGPLSEMWRKRVRMHQRDVRTLAYKKLAYLQGISGPLRLLQNFL